MFFFQCYQLFIKKRYFSKNSCAAYGIGSDYLNGSAIRQDYLETAIKWISKGNIEVYMSNHQNDPNASALWSYFQSVITWVESTFTVKRKKKHKTKYRKKIQRIKNEKKESLFFSVVISFKINRFLFEM